jgi:predicted RNase H-like nuclease (RuvC/YqgF family)
MKKIIASDQEEYWKFFNKMMKELFEPHPPSPPSPEERRSSSPPPKKRRISSPSPKQQERSRKHREEERKRRKDLADAFTKLNQVLERHSGTSELKDKTRRKTILEKAIAEINALKSTLEENEVQIAGLKEQIAGLKEQMNRYWEMFFSLSNPTVRPDRLPDLD